MCTVDAARWGHDNTVLHYQNVRLGIARPKKQRPRAVTTHDNHSNRRGDRTAAPSPLHRDPDADGDDYGCFTDTANAAVSELVRETVRLIADGVLRGPDAVVTHVRRGLTKLRGSGATDTIVKENVFHALSPALRGAGIEIPVMSIYGW